MAKRVSGDRGSGGASVKPCSATPVAFAFGAVFTPLLAIPLQADRTAAPVVADFLATASGRFWIADASARLLRIYSQEGRPWASLERRATGLRRPVSLASLHGGRWIAGLDGHVPAVAILDETGRTIRRFPLPEVDRPVQIRSLNDRQLAVVGSGWGAGAGRLVHLYTAAGEYVESLFGEPRGAGPDDRAFVATAGPAVYLGHSRTDSFAVYDLEARAVVSFARLAAAAADPARPAGPPAPTAPLRGLLAAPCGPLIARYAAADGRGYAYDLYQLDGTPLALGLRSPERVVAVEGPFFYSLREDRQPGVELRVWRLELDGALPPAGDG